jgi:hypothetical protein
MKQVDKITLKELKQMAKKMYGDIVKADVDVAKKIIVIDMELHVDGEAYLLERGSKRIDLWGINLLPAKFGADEFIEFDSMINYKSDNTSRFVGDEAVRAKIKAIVDGVVHE